MTKITYSNFLCELFDKPLSYEWQTKGGKFNWTAKFKTTDAKLFYVAFDNQVDDEGTWSAYFIDSIGRISKTGDVSNPIEVFSTVIAVIKEFAKKNTAWKRIGIGASKTENRDRLYHNMIKKFFKGKISTEDEEGDPDSKIIYIYRSKTK